MPGEKVVCESCWNVSQSDRADKLSGLGGSGLGTPNKVQLRTNLWLPPSWQSPDLTPARQSCPSKLSQSRGPRIVGDIHGDVPEYPLILRVGRVVLVYQYKDSSVVNHLFIRQTQFYTYSFRSNTLELGFNAHCTARNVQLDIVECICRIIFLCGRRLNPDWVIRVLKGIVLVGCWVTWLIVFVQRGKEELREATALLTAQQTSLEIIVNMCCSDGEWCGHGQPCWPQAFFVKYISYDTVTNYVFVYRISYYSEKCSQMSHLRI